MSSATVNGPWWTTRPDGLSLRTRLGTAAIALALLVLVAAIWASPLASETSASSRASETDALREQLAEAQAELSVREAVGGPPGPGGARGPAGPTPEPSPSPTPPSSPSPSPSPEADDGTRRAPSGEPRADRGEPPVPAPRGGSEGPAHPRSPVLPPRGSAPEPPATPTSPPRAPTPPAPDTSQPPARPAVPAPSPTPPEQPDEPDTPRTPPQTAPPVPEPPPTTLTTADLLEPDLRYYGMYTVQSPFNWATLDEVAARSGRLPSLAGYFSGWDKDFRDDAVTRAWSRGMLPMLTWESRPSGSANDQRTEADYSLPTILGDPENGVPGAHDDYLRAYARGIADLGLPMAIRLNHEMNGDWYPWSEMDKEGDPINGNRPGDYAEVWRHVHGIFEEEGANEHVIWVWAPNITNNLPTALRGLDDLERLYPGDEYVDWLGVSGYYRPPYREDQTPTFEYTFDRTLDQLRELADKPILLAEVGASEVGGRKAEWISSFFEGFTRPENDDVVGFAWFHLTVTSTVRGEIVTNDWRVDSHRDSFEAFVTGLTDPRTRLGGTPYGDDPSVPRPPPDDTSAVARDRADEGVPEPVP